MPQALITINATPGSDTDLPINTLVQLNNQNIGGETTYDWTILDQPEGASDSLSSPSVQNPTFTPRKEGTYLLQLIVNQGLASEQTDQVVAAVRHLKTRDRIPAAGETSEADASDGWSKPNGVDAILKRAIDMQADPGLIVAQVNATTPAAGKCVRIVGVATIKSGLPGQEDVPLVGVAAATDADIDHSLLGVMVGAVDGGSITNGKLVFVRVMGLMNAAVSGTPGVGDQLYINDSGDISDTPGSTERAIGIFANTGQPFIAGIDGGLGSGGSLQTAYDGGAGVAIATGTPIALDTSGAASPATQEALTITDGTDSTIFYGDGIELPDGDDATPALRWSGGGYYAVGATLRTSIGGAEVVRVTANSVRTPDGTSSSVAHSFLNEVNSGLGLQSAGSVALYVAAGATVIFTATQTTFNRTVRAQGSLTAPTGSEQYFTIAPTINKATSGDYTILDMNVTETSAPGTDNRLLNLRVGGTPVAYIASDGKIVADPGATNDPGFAFVGDEDTGFTAANANQLSAVLGSSERFRFLQQSGSAQIWVQGAGTTTFPNLATFNDNTGIYLPGGGAVGVTANGTAAALFNEDGADFAATLDAATGDEFAWDYQLTVNKATSGNYTAVRVNVTETAAPGTDDRLLDLQVGGVSQAYIQNDGQILLTDNNHRIGDNGSGTMEFEAANSQVSFRANGSERMRLIGSALRIAGGGTAGSVALGINNGFTEGLFLPASNQLGLAANGEAVIVDNDSATPSFRPDADNVWTLGEAALRFATLYSATLDTGDVNLQSLHRDMRDVRYTIVEGRDGLYLRSHHTGKAYRFTLEEVGVDEAPMTNAELAEAGLLFVNEAA